MSIKAKYVAVFLVLSAIMIIVALGASGVVANSEDKGDANTIATAQETNETPPKMEEITEPTTETMKTTEPAQEETTSVVVTEPKQNYTDDELYYLAAVVCREAGGESDEIQLLVANVVINRVNSAIYPDSIYGVLTDYMQYGMMWKYGVSFPKWADQDTIDHCYDIARRILEGERVCPDNVLFQAEFEQGSGIYKQFDGFYFCYYG